MLERPQACAALAALLSFAELTADAAGLGKFTLALHDPGRFMRLDAAAQRALHVFPARGDANSSFSLYGLMCKARTAMGKRRLKVRGQRFCSSTLLALATSLAVRCCLALALPLTYSSTNADR